MGEESRSEFAVRYYRWALAEARREAKGDYELLRKVKSGRVAASLDYFRSLEIEQQNDLMSGLVKSALLRAAELAGEPMTDGEELLVGSHRRYLGASIGKYLFPPGSEDMVGWLRNRTIDGKKLTQSAKAALEPICGPIVERPGSQWWVHRRSFGPWSVETSVEVRVTGPYQMRYLHGIRYGETAEFNLEPGNYISGISLMMLMGLGQTEWTWLSPGDEGRAAESLTDACSHFQGAVAALLDGLTPPSGPQTRDPNDPWKPIWEPLKLSQ
jgi:hypothetical protein